MGRIGIIGGGVGGLAVAWELWKHLDHKGITPDINVFEANDRFGGNVDTKHFDFGEGPGSEGKSLQRWADMGVNDFNTAAYGNIVDVMNEIHYTKENGCYKNLEDSTTYYTTKGHAMTANATPSGKRDPWWGTAMPQDLYDSMVDFMQVAGDDGDGTKYHGYTMEEYFKAKKEEGVKWHPLLAPEVIYPRVNGMYFTSGPLGPRSMPFHAVMHYYKIQEGAGSKVKADRNYFVGGSSTWIDALINHMSKWPGMTFHCNYKADVHPVSGGNGYLVRNKSKDSKVEQLECEYICLTVPADDALRLMVTDPAGFDPNNPGLPSAASNIMSQIKYETAVSVAHTDSRLMPVNRNAWSTYNIVIHEPGSVALKPYVINYVANRHQNDGAPDSPYNKFGSPEFFLSINPHIPISEDKVLMDTRTGKPAVANLKHFVFDFDCMQAQADIHGQQGRNRIYYASGWTAGSGLHTECWAKGIEVAWMMFKAIEAGAEVVEEPVTDRAEFITSRLIAAASTDC